MNTNLKKQAIRSGGVTLFSQFVRFFIQMFGTMVLARILAPDDFGLVAMVISITGFFIIFKDLGLTDATIQKKEINDSQLSTLFWINAASGVAIALVIIALSPLIAWFFGRPQLKLIAIISSLNFLLAGLSIQHMAILKRNMLFFKIATIEIISNFLSIITAILLAWYGYGYWALVFRPITYALYAAMGVWIVYPWRPRLPAFKSGISEMLVFGLNEMGFFLTNYFFRNLDKVLIGWRYGEKELGYYSRAFYLFQLPVTQLIMALRSVAISTLSKLKNEIEKFKNYYIKAVTVVSFLGMPFCGFIVVECHDLILLVLGPQWDKAAEIFAILGIGAPIRIILLTGGWIHISIGRADRLLRWGVISSLITVIALFIGLPFGPKGIASAYTISLFILIGPGLSYAGKPIELKFSRIFLEIWRYFVASGFSGILCWYICLPFSSLYNPFVRLTISFLIFTGLYLVILVALFKSTKPIENILSLMGEMLPNKVLRKIIPSRKVVP